MSPAIGAACAKDLIFLARDKANSFRQGSLDCSQSSLCGPAAEVGAVVRDDELNTNGDTPLVDQFEHGFGSAIAPSRSDLGDSGVSPGSVLKSRADFVKQVLN